MCFDIRIIAFGSQEGSEIRHFPPFSAILSENWRINLSWKSLPRWVFAFFSIWLLFWTYHNQCMRIDIRIVEFGSQGSEIRHFLPFSVILSENWRINLPWKSLPRWVFDLFSIWLLCWTYHNQCMRFDIRIVEFGSQESSEIRHFLPFSVILTENWRINLKESTSMSFCPFLNMIIVMNVS